MASGVEQTHRQRTDGHAEQRPAGMPHWMRAPKTQPGKRQARPKPASTLTTGEDPNTVGNRSATMPLAK